MKRLNCTTTTEVSNPYVASNVAMEQTNAIAHQSIAPRRRDWFCWSTALLPAASIYLAWGVAWLALGHPPRPSLDDPKNIGAAFSVIYLLSGLVLISIPAIAIFGPSVQLVTRDRSLLVRTVYASISMLILAGAVLLLRWDPLDVMTWFLD